MYIIVCFVGVTYSLCVFTVPRHRDKATHATTFIEHDMAFTHSAVYKCSDVQTTT